MEQKDIFKILNTIFSDKNFLLENGTNDNRFLFSELTKRLNIVLCYYIATRDNNILKYKEIEENYFEIGNRIPSDEYLNNILINGYLTHSFPGNKKKYVEEYGFDYFDKLPLDEKNKLQIIRNQLVSLEDNLGRCSYFRDRVRMNDKEIVDKELFMTFPGAKTIYYSIFTPERLYRGPIDSYLFESFPIVVGESKKDYLMRVIKFKVKRYSDKKISEEEIISLADNIIEYYSRDNSCIGFINIDDIKNIPLFTCMYNRGNGNDFKEFYNEMSLGNYNLKDIFTTKMSDNMEIFDRGNLVTLSSYINKASISLVDFPDWYELRQIFLKSIGMEEGKLIKYRDCTEIKRVDEIYEEVKLLYKSR